MHHRNPKLLFLILISVLMTMPYRNLEAQIPDEFKNLQVLSPGISKAELVSTMKTFTGSLGVRCEYCHVGEGNDLSKFDFASDEKSHKKKARIMLQMVEAINSKYLSYIGKKGEVLEVTCVTCHHGQPEPKTIEQVLTAVTEKEGVEAAVKKYRELKKEYYGGFAYDFTEDPLNRLAQQMAEKGKIQEGIRFLKLNEEIYPKSAMVQFYLGEIYLKNNDREQALTHYRKASEMMPDNPFLKKRIEELTVPSN